MKQTKIRRSLRFLPLAILLILVLLWFWPVRIFSGDAGEVESIKIFDGNTGNLVTVTDRETIEKLVENFKSVYLRRTFDFGSRNGFNLLVDITVKGRDETCHFTINSERHAVRESRFYSYWGTYCFSFMKELVNGGENW